ncbi:MAG: response regulator [Candidatus Magnetoovum sp. WYHC-5]|nr:response regulator [Candidatus Magnetoovum sp. WYHC-5]
MPNSKENWLIDTSSKKQDNKLSILKKISVLYVEDEESVRQSLAGLLRRRLGILYIADNGSTGLELFKEQRPDIVISDIRMPVMDGLEMAANIKQLSPFTPIIITTAFSEIPFITKSRDIGVDEYIKKPIMKDELLSAIFKYATAILCENDANEKAII